MKMTLISKYNIQGRWKNWVNGGYSKGVVRKTQGMQRRCSICKKLGTSKAKKSNGEKSTAAAGKAPHKGCDSKRA